jgi:hypothetical protein
MKNHSAQLTLVAALALLAVGSLAAATIPVDLPPPDARPPAKDKPVKVYILSGQSNMVGFGRVKGATPQYGKLFLTADPSAKPAALPMATAALLKHGVHDSIAAVYQGAYDPKAEYAKMKPARQENLALGDTNARIPSIDGPHTVVVNALINVPYNGSYELHAGFESSSHCVAELDGREVYRKEENSQPALTKVTLEKGRRYPLRITYQKGGSAALWLEQVDLKGLGDLDWVVNDLGRFRYLRGEDGSWVKRPDVFLNDAYLGKGQSAPHGVDACGPTFGPELGFGFVMGTFHDEPVIVIKADQGNRSLGWDILPPGSEGYTFDGKEYPGYGDMLDAEGKVVKFAGEGWYAGKQYDDFTASLRAVLDHFGERYPQFKDQGYEVAGFVWWQGHKDGGSAAHIAMYEKNLANLIKAWRKEFNAPNAPWAIATVAFHGKDMSENYVKIAQAQLNVADPKLHPEFGGNVKTIDARPFWRDASISPKNQDYHYNHNAETYMLCGDALGRAMVELKGGKVEYPESGMIKPVAAPPTMQVASAQELKSMTAAIKPIIMGKLLPEFAGDAASIPSYLRRGLPMENILGGKAPAKPNPVIASQMDQMIEHYELCGIDEFSWKRFGPEMKTAGWEYLTFDPAEKKEDPDGDRYRKVTLPAGSENWFAVDFDAAKAGWKTGKAPFGQKDGKQEALNAGCRVGYCGCNITPATLWDKEVLLMRQTFAVPALDPSYRYRIVVGGAGHAWSGEGFALYLNGKLVSEATGGYYKGGGPVRGALVFNDQLPEFANGKITVAAKVFLRRNGFRGKPAAPSGHLSVWLESAKLPPIALDMAAKFKN